MKKHTYILWLAIILIPMAVHAAWTDNCTSSAKCYVVDAEFTVNCDNTAGKYYNTADRTCTGENQYILGYKSLYTPNRNAVAGDTIYIRGDVADSRYYFTYANEGIWPTHSGTSWDKVIRYTQYPSSNTVFYGKFNATKGAWATATEYVKEDVVSASSKLWVSLTDHTSSGSSFVEGTNWKQLTDSNYSSVYLDGRDYIKVDHLIFQNTWTDVKINGSSYNEIGYITLAIPYFLTSGGNIANQYGSGVRIDVWPYSYGAYYKPSKHNWIHDITGGYSGGFDYHLDYGKVLNVGQESNNYAKYLSSVNTTTDQITTTASDGYASGRAAVFYTSGTLPAPLQPYTLYYLINVSANTYKLALSYADARNGTAIDLTDTGSIARSSSSLTVGTGSKSLTLDAGLTLDTNMNIVISDVSAPSTNWMKGVVTSYNSGTGALVANITSVGGSGTYSSWDVHDFAMSYNILITDNTTVENTDLYYGGHHVIGFMSKYGVLRNSKWRNDGWYGYNGCETMSAEGKCGYRNLSITGEGAAYRNQLIEKNTSNYASAFGSGHRSLAGSSGGEFRVDIPYLIMRYNTAYGGATYGFEIGASISDGCFDTGEANQTFPNYCKVDGIHAYNNTAYREGWGAEDEYVSLGYGHSLYFYGAGIKNSTGTVVKNNLFYDWWMRSNTVVGLCTSSGVPFYCCSWLGTGTCSLSTYPAIGENIGGMPAGATISSNFNYPTSKVSGVYEQTDPLFIDGTLATTTAEITSVVPNLGLQAESPAKDTATYLTQVNDADGCTAESEDCTAMVVNDPWYFQDGTWGSSLVQHANDRCIAENDPDDWCIGEGTGTYTFQADYICLSSSATAVDYDRCRQISSINYDTNTLTLASEMSWSNNDYVWLYSISDGTRVLYGDLPDYGANERSDTSSASPVVAITTPGNVNITADSLTLTGSATDDVSVSSCKYRIGSAPDGSNGTACIGTTSWSCATSGYSAGNNPVYVGCVDGDGNWGTDTVTIIYNTLNTVTASSSMAGCVISPNGAHSVVSGATDSVECSPVSGNYVCLSWTGTCTGSGTGVWTGTISGDCTVTQPCFKRSADTTVGSGALSTVGSGSPATVY